MAERNRQPGPIPRPAPVARPGEGAPSARQSRAEAVRAAAEAKRIAAEAEATRARTEQLRIEGQLKAAERAAERQARGQTPGERIYQGGVNLAGIVAGGLTGSKIAQGIERRHAAALTARGKQVKALGDAASRLLASRMPQGLKKAKLKGIVATADALKLTRVRGPLGLAPVAALLAEGAVSRFVLPRTIENQAARELVGAVGTGSMIAGGTLLYKRAAANATLSRLPEAKAFAAIQTARAVQAGQATQAAAAAARAGSAARVLAAGSRVLSVAGKVALPLQIAATAYESYQGYQREGVKGALIGAGDSLTFGAVSALRRLMGQRSAQAADGERLGIERSAARVMHEQRLMARRAAAGLQPSTGWTRGYARLQAGRTVQVRGYKTPPRR